MLVMGLAILAYVILDGFDLGVGILHPFAPTNDRERRIAINAIGPVWDGNEVWLLTGGGALFAAFPPVYATVFSGFYLALMALALFIVSLVEPKAGVARRVALALGAGAVAVALLTFGQHGDLFHGTYRVDGFSQAFKVIIAIGFFLAVALGACLLPGWRALKVDPVEAFRAD